MFKAIILLTRREDMSAEAFADWWLVRHAPLARTLPELRRLTFNLVTNGGSIDGVSELWFDSQAAFEAAYASDIGKAVAADSLAHVGRRERLFVNEHSQL
ncbi:MAG: EthD family reductase [Burkholderiales bacterium]|jgi:uncharacterized protein (TIGR02118 family)|nr:MAG: EthD family reductase [Burkholderiales bacterium]